MPDTGSRPTRSTQAAARRSPEMWVIESLTGCLPIFHADKTKECATCAPLPLHNHQEEAIRVRDSRSRNCRGCASIRAPTKASNFKINSLAIL